MKTNMSKKKKIAAMALSALAAASVCAIPVAAAEAEPAVSELRAGAYPQQMETNAVGVTVHSLTPNPSYLENEGEIVPFGSPWIPSNSIWYCSTQGRYAFSDTFGGGDILYSDHMFTGKYSYTVTISCNSVSKSSVVCTAYNASSGDKELGGIVVLPGQSKTMTLTGLSTTSKVFLKFASTNSSASLLSISGSIA